MLFQKHSAWRTVRRFDNARHRIRSMTAQASSMERPGLVSPEWLAERHTQPDIRILDASLYPTMPNRNPVQEYKTQRIPGALFFDLDGVADTSSSIPHMLPTAEQFAAAADALGITNDTRVVIYDGLHQFSSPRAWWTFKVFGHDKVYILEGGLPAWQALGLPLDTSPPPSEESVLASRIAAQSPKQSSYKAKLDVSKVRSLNNILDNIKTQKELVVDARSGGRFQGVEPEPRKGLPSGHMPGAKNVPFPSLLNNGKFKPVEELRAVFKDAGVDPSGPLVGSCGSGLTAAIVAHAVYQMTDKVIPIYDGAWMEYAAQENAQVVTAK